MYIPKMVLLVIVLLVIESVFVHKTIIKLDILDQKMKLDIFVSYLAKPYQPNNFSLGRPSNQGRSAMGNKIFVYGALRLVHMKK